MELIIDKVPRTPLVSPESSGCRLAEMEAGGGSAGELRRDFGGRESESCAWVLQREATPVGSSALSRARMLSGEQNEVSDGKGHETPFRVQFSKLQSRTIGVRDATPR